MMQAGYTFRAAHRGGPRGARERRLVATAAVWCGLAACGGLWADQPGPLRHAPILATPGLELSPPRLTLEQHLFARLEAQIPAGPVSGWPAARPLPRLAASPIRLENPLDLAKQYRVPPDYCPGFLPEYEPQKTVDEMCRRDLLTNWQLFQGDDTNPFVVASEQVALYNADPGELHERLAWALAYAWVHRGHDDTPNGIADVLLSDPDRVRDDVLLSLAAPPVVDLLPEALTEIAAVEGEVSADLRMTVAFAHDSVAQYEETLATAGRRGLGALVIAGRGELGDAQTAVRTAQRLKQRGLLPADFRVIPGEYIQSRSGTVLGLFLRERIVEGMTMGATVRAIKAQGGLALMARPGDIGSAPFLARLPFDGFLMQPGNFELFRTLKLLHDPRYAEKPALYGSNLTYTWGAGLPYSMVPLADGADPLRAGLAQHQGYAAGGLYLPWMMFLLTKPIALYQGTLNKYFEVNDYLTVKGCELLRADGLILRTSWDEAMRDLISLSGAPGAVTDLLDGDSPLLDPPKLTYLEAEYGTVALGYDRNRRQWLLAARWQW